MQIGGILVVVCGVVGAVVGVYGWAQVRQSISEDW